MSPDELAIAWPRYLGKRLRLRARVDHAVDPTRVVVRAGSKRFSVLLEPDRIWMDEREQTFSVLGSSTILVPGGPRTVAELLLEAEGCGGR